MRIARPARPERHTDRTRWLGTVLLGAVFVMAFAAVPVVAAADGAVAADPLPAVDPAPTPSSAPTDVPAPMAEPSPSPSPVPTGTLEPTPAPTGTPEPTVTPAPTGTPPPTPTPVPTATPNPTPSFPTSVTTLGSSVRFYGRGWGHGVGLSQYGARGRAIAGQTAEHILAAYYKGTTLGTISPTKAVRVLVLNAFPAPSSAPLEIIGRKGTWSLSVTPLRAFPPDATLKAWRDTRLVDGVRSTVWRLRVFAANGTRIWKGAVSGGTPEVRPLQSSTVLQVASRTSTYDRYRGSLTLRLAASSVSVVNTLGMDLYLRGVVPVEMPAAWPTQALRAQAIAARSYAAFHLRPSQPWDVYDDTRSQVYRGKKAEQATTNAVIVATPGSVLRYNGALVNAVFHSTGGGATESSEFAFVGSTGTIGTKVAYLRGLVDQPAAGLPYDASSPYFTWSTSTLSRTQLSSMFAKDSRTKVGDLTALDLRRRGVSGRLYQVVLIGSSGTKTVSADTFRSVYNTYKPASAAVLRSNLFDTNPIR
jgi:SpoIID/LytB domain protein